MNQTIQMDTKKYIPLIKRIREYDNSLDTQNLWWSVVSMVGKINNHGLEPQLLDSISHTQERFDDLKENLIKSLIRRYLDKVDVELKLKSQAFIDILNRNLFERTADVGFLSTDDAIVNYLQQQNFESSARQKIESRLNEYVKKYSVYDDIVLLTPEFEVTASLSNPSLSTRSSAAIFTQALNTDDFIEHDHPIEICAPTNIPLYYIQRIKHQQQVVGILCMSFKLQDELIRISKTLQQGDTSLQLSMMGADNNCLFSSQGQCSSSFKQRPIMQLHEEKLNGVDSFFCSAKTEGYQGFKGLDWTATAALPLKDGLEFDEEEQTLILNENSSLFPQDLHILNQEINTRLLIVILNGKIISLKNKVQSFLPVLDYFQDIGARVREVFSDSIQHIHTIAHKTMEEKVIFSATVALDVMDRNLYERANDCRWWALNPTIINALQSDMSTRRNHKIEQILEYINSLYTVYTVLFVYDHEGTVKAVSNAKYNQLIGHSIRETNEFRSCLNTTSSQEYVVSHFEQSTWYDNQPTYIYHAAFRDQDNANTLGGIGIVFDSEPEFRAILEDFIPKESDGTPIKGSFACFVDDNDIIISSTDNAFSLSAGNKLSDACMGASLAAKQEGVFDLKIKEQNYIVACKCSRGYREYKTKDGYENNIYCYVFVES